MKVKRGDIIWLYSDIKVDVSGLGENIQRLRRPYVVISNNINNSICPTINVACLSKNMDKAYYPMHVSISKEKYHMDYDSVIFTEQVMTINKDRIQRIIGSLDEEDLARLDKALYIQLIDEKAVNE